MVKAPNPFSITKAVDLNDEQIERLWVKIFSDGDDLEELDHPISPMPTFILGAKGSGKTHLMRHQAFQLQKLRYIESGMDVRSGVNDDGYIGLYVRCSGLQSSRFSGKRQPDEVWEELFSYYFELWLTQHLLYVLRDLGVGKDDGDEAFLVGEIAALFDRLPTLREPTVEALLSFLSKLQKDLDYEINNCLLKGSLDVVITATRGKLIFGIPALVARRYGWLSEVLFSYDIDEFENLTESQQRHVNTLVREKESPATFRVGARTYGVKTLVTNSGGEENQRDSEFSEIALDARFRENKARYDAFVRALIWKRLSGKVVLPTEEGQSQFLDRQFECVGESPTDPVWVSYLKDTAPAYRHHFVRFRQIMSIYGVPAAKFDTAYLKLKNEGQPVVEKLNLTMMYQELARGRTFEEAVDDIAVRSQRQARNEESPQSAYRTSLQHYGDDLAAQLLRENGQKIIYCGLQTLIQMSAGIPRALLTVLRSIFEWAEFNDERPFEGGIISLQSQQRGVIEASNWYFTNMRKAGDDGALIQSAIERLANLLRINRFGDKPIESSLSTFSVAEQDIDSEARRILKLSEARAFIHRVPSGQRHRNSQQVLGKFQLSPMLAPRWDLPLVRRGTLDLSPDDFNAIFAPATPGAYEEVERKYRAKVMAPFRGHTETTPQLGLFDL